MFDPLKDTPEGMVGRPWEDKDNEGFLCLAIRHGELCLMKWCGGDGYYKLANWTPTLSEATPGVLNMIEESKLTVEVTAEACRINSLNVSWHRNGGGPDWRWQITKDLKLGVYAYGDAADREQAKQQAIAAAKRLVNGATS